MQQSPADTQALERKHVVTLLQKPLRQYPPQQVALLVQAWPLALQGVWQVPLRHCRPSQQGEVLEHAAFITAHVGGRRHRPASQVSPVQHVAPPEPHAAPSAAQGGTHCPASQVSPAQQGWVLLQAVPIALHSAAHTPSRQRLPAQQSASAAHTRPCT